MHIYCVSNTGIPMEIIIIRYPDKWHNTGLGAWCSDLALSLFLYAIAFNHPAFLLAHGKHQMLFYSLTLLNLVINLILT